MFLPINQLHVSLHLFLSIHPPLAAMAPTKYTPLELHFTDGDDLGYPQQVEKLVSNDGTYEYFRPVAEDEQKDIMWRSKAAKALIEKYNQSAKGEVTWFTPELLASFLLRGRGLAGRGLAESDGLPESDELTESTTAGKEYIFKTLPQGYKLYEHVKGKKVCIVLFLVFSFSTHG